ncbi:unnamed protein product [Rotaria socialis]
MLFDVALTSPQQVAIEFEEQTWTYAELLMNVICIARHLQVELGDIIYQYVDPSIEMVCGLLGIMCAGGAYCPLSPSDPSAYVRTLIDETRGRFVLVHGNTCDRFSSMISQQIHMINIQHILLADTREEAPEQNIHVESNTSSFIVCTSDANGRQKIIVHTHASLIAGVHNLISWDTNHSDKVLQIAESSWAIHLFEILMPLLTVPSGTLVLLPSSATLNMTRFCKTIKDKQITIFFTDSSLLKKLLEYFELNDIERSETLERVRILWTSSEFSKPKYLAKIKSYSSQTRIFLRFGINETSAAIGREIKETIDELTNLSTLSIGCSLAEYKCLLLDESNDRKIISPSDTNSIGQIYLAGAGLFKCYYNNPGLTSTSRVIIDNEEYFKTGDLARYNAKNELEYIGCIDFQIKVDDQLVETADIERTIIACCPNEISSCLVVKLSQEEDLLVAYIISDSSQLATESIRDYCKDRLRKYMVPSYFVVLNKFPLDTNGQVDRKQLPLPSSIGSEFDVCLLDRTVSEGTRRCWSSLPSIPIRPCSNINCLIMGKRPLTTENNNINKINKNIFHASLPTIINISNDDECINKHDPLLNEHDSTNVLSNLSNSCNLEERDENKLPFPDFVEKAFYFLRQTTPPRYQCLKLITWPWFDLISMFVILINCITLGMHQPCTHQSDIESSKKCDTTFCIYLQTIDYYVFAFFTIEMCLKMIAMGIFGKKTYLAESWNRLDCFIVLTGLAELLIPGDYISLSAIRTVRVLRPLRTINRVPSMRIIVLLLLDTLPMLGNVLLLCFFMFFIFGVIGVELWKGLLRNRCFLELNTTIIADYSLFGDFHFESFYIPPDQSSFICSKPSSSGMTKCSDIPRLRQDNKTCDFNFNSLNLTSKNQTINECINWNQYYRSCATSDQNPFSGSISFDNIFSAWLTIFQIITCEGWVSIMYYVQDAHSFWDWIYFVSLIVIGSFFMMNLCLAVISAQFGVTKRRETERMLAEQKRLTELNPTAVTNDRPGSCWKELVKYVNQLSKRLSKRLFYKNCRQKSDKVNHRHTRREKTKKDVSISDINIVSLAPLINQKHRSNCPHYQCQPLVVSTTIDYGHDTYEIGPDIVGSRSENNNLPNESNRRINENLEFEQQEQQTDRNDVCDCYDQDKGVDTSENSQEENSNFHRECICGCCSLLMVIQKFIARIVANKYFNRIIFSAIIINALSMAIEYHGQPESLTNALEYSNYVFLILFAIEMLFKIIAGGIFKYLSNPFNIFDGSIVIISFIELYGQQNSGLSVLRTFRLLRVIKIVRFLPELRRQLVSLIIH